MQEMWIQSLSWEDLLEKEMATHSSILAWENHGQRNLVGYIVHGSQKSWTRLSDFNFTFHFHASEKEMAPHSSVFA